MTQYINYSMNISSTFNPNNYLFNMSTPFSSRERKIPRNRLKALLINFNLN